MKTQTLQAKGSTAKTVVLNIIQLSGILTATLVIPSPETTALLAALPDPIAGNIGKIALALLVLKPIINAVADLVDNGKLDQSWKS